MLAVKTITSYAITKVLNISVLRNRGRLYRWYLYPGNGMIDFQNDPVPALDATEYWVASAAYLSFHLLTED